MANEADTTADYDDAFAKFSADELPALSTPAKAEVEEGTEPAETLSAVAEESEVPADDANAADSPAVAAEQSRKDAPTGKAGDEDAALLAKLDALLETRTKSEPPAPAAETPPAPAQEQAVYTPEEQVFLTEYETEWADVSKAESLKRRVEYEKLVQYVFNEVAAVLRPMTQDLQALAQERQKAQYRQVVPEYDTLQADLAAWTEKQPAYLRAAYQHVIQRGTPEDVADLVERYKRDTATNTVVESPQQKATELPPSAKKAAQALAPVSSKRSSVVAAETDKNDFDGAFEKFAAMT